MLTVRYAAGVESFDYREETIDFRTQETRPVHTLAVSLSQNQPWGSVDASLEGGQHLDDTNKNFASVSGGTSPASAAGMAAAIASASDGTPLALLCEHTFSGEP